MIHMYIRGRDCQRGYNKQSQNIEKYMKNIKQNTTGIAPLKNANGLLDVTQRSRVNYWINQFLSYLPDKRPLPHPSTKDICINSHDSIKYYWDPNHTKPPDRLWYPPDSWRNTGMLCILQHTYKTVPPLIVVQYEMTGEDIPSYPSLGKGRNASLLTIDLLL